MDGKFSQQEHHKSHVTVPSPQNICRFLVRTVTFLIFEGTNGSIRHKYSVERLKAFQDYRSRTSGWWICMAICMAPLFSIGMLIGMNFIPLKSPEDGWKANYVFFLRMHLASLLTVRSMQLQRDYYIGRQMWSLRLNLIVAVGISITYVGVMVCFAAWVAFPMRFLLLVPILFSVPIALLVVTIAPNQRRKGKKRLSVEVRSPSILLVNGQQQPQLQFQQQLTSVSQSLNLIKSYKRILVFEFSLIFIYSLFEVGFTSLRDRPYLQAIYSLLLPILKVLLNRLAKKVVFAHVEDLAAESAVFTVTFFNALFVSMCLSTTGSSYTAITLMVLDVANIVLALIRIQHKCSTLANLVASQEGASGAGMRMNGDLVGMVLAFAQKHRQDIENDSNLRWFCSNHIAFQQNSRVMSLLQNSRAQTFEEATAGSTSRKKLTHAISTKAFQKSTETLTQVLILMFDVEYLVLMEFVEALIPYMYAVYLLVTYYSPCQNYIIGTRGLSPEAMILSLRQMCLYGSLEFGSLLLLYLLIRWKFRINVFHVLAFVLETHFKSIQGKLFIFFCLVLHFNLIHVGMHQSSD